MPKVIQKFLPVGSPDISEVEIREVTNVLRSGWLGTGKVTSEFEKEFARSLGREEALGTSSCTMGLVLALKACGVRQGDEVITSPLTFSATVNAILQSGARPVFADVSLNGCIKPLEIHRNINGKTKAIIPVHYTGSPCEMDQIMETAEDYGLKVIEDAAHAFGGTYVKKERNMCVSRKLGAIGHYGVFSFYSTKNITCGEGGMLLSRQGDLEFLRTLSQQGLSSGAWNRYGAGKIAPYEVVQVGYKGNLPDVLSAIGLGQLRRWDELKEKRKKVWDVYTKMFGPKDYGHSMHLYTLEVDDRDNLREKLHEEGIGTGIHYEALHLQPAFRFMGYKEGDFPNAERIGRRTLSLPLSSNMTEEDAWRVVEVMHKVSNGI